MKHWFLIAGLTFLAIPACGGDDGGGGAGGSSGTGATGGGATGGSAGSSTGGAAGGGGTSGTGATGGGGTGGAAGGGGTSTGGASGTGGAAGSGATDGGTSCNTLVNDGADIPETQESGSPPTMTGGTIPDGIYLLTARKDWQGSCNCTTRQKLVVKNGGTTVETVRREDAGADTHLDGTFATSSNDLTITISCPSGVGTLQKKYTVTSTTPVQLQIFDGADQSMDVFTKQ